MRASPFSTHRDGTLIEVVVQPRASRSEVAGLHDGALRLRVTAPPVDGAANSAIVALLATALGVPKSAVQIVSGPTARRKRVLVRGVDARYTAVRLGVAQP